MQIAPRSNPPRAMAGRGGGGGDRFHFQTNRLSWRTMDDVIGSEKFCKTSHSSRLWKDKDDPYTFHDFTPSPVSGFLGFSRGPIMDLGLYNKFSNLCLIPKNINLNPEYHTPGHGHFLKSIGSLRERKMLVGLRTGFGFGLPIRKNMSVPEFGLDSDPNLWGGRKLTHSSEIGFGLLERRNMPLPTFGPYSDPDFRKFETDLPEFSASILTFRFPFWRVRDNYCWEWGGCLLQNFSPSIPRQRSTRIRLLLLKSLNGEAGHLRMSERMRINTDKIEEWLIGSDLIRFRIRYLHLSQFGFVLWCTWLIRYPASMGPWSFCGVQTCFYPLPSSSHHWNLEAIRSIRSVIGIIAKTSNVRYLITTSLLTAHLQNTIPTKFRGVTLCVQQILLVLVS